MVANVLSTIMERGKRGVFKITYSLETLKPNLGERNSPKKQVNIIRFTMTNLKEIPQWFQQTRMRMSGLHMFYMIFRYKKGFETPLKVCPRT